MSDATCPRCESTSAYREMRRVPRYTYRHITQPDPRRKTWAGWYKCPDCWHKWDGIVDHEDGVLPAGVVARGKLELEEETR